jgi:ComF family protein
MQELKAFAKNFINLFYPLHCMSCNSQLDALNESRLCDKCGASIKPNAMPPFELETTGVMAYSAAIYEGTMKELIHSFKYKGKLTLTRTFIKLMADHIKENPEILDVDLITAVPLHRSRLMRREFNQSLVLANKLAREFSLPAKDALKKTKKTKYQNELSKSERLTNLKGAFRVRDNNDISGKDILLVDDVMTTGATLNECADTLLAGGAGSVKCFTLARGI